MSKESSVQAFTDLIIGRRSVREGFMARQVPTEIIQKILDCGNNAASSKNAQPWILHVVTSNSTMLMDVADAMRRSKAVEEFRPLDPKTGARRREYVSTVVESAQVIQSVPLAIFIENRGLFTHSREAVWSAIESARPDAVIGNGLEDLSLGICVANMWLAGQALGLRGVFMGDVLVTEEFIQNLLGMNGDLVGVLALGYTDKTPYPKTIRQDSVVWHEPKP